MEFIEYSKCSTCKKAKMYLDNKKIEYIDRPIKDNNPSKEELLCWVDKYNIPVNRLFNTSGLLYRSLNLKDKMDKMSLEEKIDILASDGMLVKRPIIVTSDKVLVGFKVKEWDEYFK